MVAAVPLRKRLLAASAVTYVGVFALFLAFERPGLGIGHGFYVAILLAAMAGGPLTGACAGVAATACYAVAVVANPHIPPTEVPTIATAIRMVTYILVGTMVGYYASSNRRLMGGAYDLVDELTLLAKRDHSSGLPNTRAFEVAVLRRLEQKRPFALFVAEVPTDGSPEELADLLRREVGQADDIARVGDNQYAVLRADVELPAATAARFERALAESAPSVTCGWATYPRDGENALTLFRAADERLYARKIFRGEASSLRAV